MTAQTIVLNPRNPLTPEIEKACAPLMACGYPYGDAVLSVMKSNDRLRRQYFTAEKLIGSPRVRPAQ